MSVRWCEWACLFLGLCGWRGGKACMGAVHKHVEQKVTLGCLCHFSGVVHLGFWDRVSNFAWNLLIGPSWLATKPQESSCLCLLDYRDVSLCPAFLFLTWVLGIKLRFSPLDSKHYWLSVTRPCIHLWYGCCCSLIIIHHPIIHLMCDLGEIEKFYYFENKI